MRLHIRLGIAMLMVCCLALVAGTASAQQTPYYILDGDSISMYIIQNGQLTSTVPILARGSAPAITGTIWVMTYTDDATAEYTLGGAPTGNTGTGPGTVQQLLDGTTDGAQHNYAAQWGNSTNVVLRFDTRWQNQQVLFTLTSGDQPTGTTYDPTTGHLFFTMENDHTVREYNLAGQQVNSFSIAALTGRPCCLAYELATNTLWMSENGGSTIYQYSKSGTQLNSIIVPNFSPSNNWGGEMMASTVSIPVLDVWGLLAFTALLVGSGVLALRSRRVVTLRRPAS